MKNGPHINVNPEVLKWARESLPITRNKAAEQTGIAINRLTLLENGDRQPTLEELKTLAKKYKRTIATLLLDNPPQEKPLPTDRRSVNSQDLGHFDEKTIMAVRKARALAQSYVELLQEMGMDITRFKQSASINEDPKVVAKALRSFLNLDELRHVGNINMALEGYIERVETLGAAVFQLSLTKDNLRGFSITDDIVPIIIIKRGGEQPYAKNFTLFHELGHLLLNESGLCDLSEKSGVLVEKWCNAFAAEMLVPVEELLQMKIVDQYRQKDEKIWKKQDLLSLGEFFHVGPLVILRSLLENNLTTPEFYREKHKAWNKPQFGRSKLPEGRNIAKEIVKEKGRTYVSLAFSAYDLNHIDLKDLADYLGVKLSYIPRTRELLNA